MHPCDKREGRLRLSETPKDDPRRVVDRPEFGENPAFSAGNQSAAAAGAAPAMAEQPAPEAKTGSTRFLVLHDRPLSSKATHVADRDINLNRNG